MATEIILIVIALLLFILAIALFNGKCKWLISGYNTLSEKEKSKYDEKVVCKAAGFICCVCCVILCVITYIAHKANSGMIDEDDMMTLAVVLLAVLIIAIIAVGLYISKKRSNDLGGT